MSYQNFDGPNADLLAQMAAEIDRRDRLLGGEPPAAEFTLRPAPGRRLRVVIGSEQAFVWVTDNAKLKGRLIDAFRPSAKPAPADRWHTRYTTAAAIARGVQPWARSPYQIHGSDSLDPASILAVARCGPRVIALQVREQNETRIRLELLVAIVHGRSPIVRPAVHWLDLTRPGARPESVGDGRVALGVAGIDEPVAARLTVGDSVFSVSAELFMDDDHPNDDDNDDDGNGDDEPVTNEVRPLRLSPQHPAPPRGEHVG